MRRTSWSKFGIFVSVPGKPIAKASPTVRAGEGRASSQPRFLLVPWASEIWLLGAKRRPVSFIDQAPGWLFAKTHPWASHPRGHTLCMAAFQSWSGGNHRAMSQNQGQRFPNEQLWEQYLVVDKRPCDHSCPCWRGGQGDTSGLPASPKDLPVASFSH